jgi:hypothetical protein
MQEPSILKNIFNDPPNEIVLSKLLYFLGIFSTALGVASLIFPFLDIQNKIPFKVLPFFPYLLFALLITSGILCLISSKMLKEAKPKGPAIGFAGALIFDFSFLILGLLDIILKNTPEKKDAFFFYLLITYVILSLPAGFLMALLRKLSFSINSLNDETVE